MVDRADDGFERRRRDALVDADAPAHGLVAIGQLDVRGRTGLMARAQGVLRVVDYVNCQAQAALERVDKRGDRAVARALDRDGFSVDQQVRRDVLASPSRLPFFDLQTLK